MQTLCRRGDPPLCLSPYLPVAAPAALCGCQLRWPPALLSPHPAEHKLALSSPGPLLSSMQALDGQAAAAAAAAGNADSGSMSAGTTAPATVVMPLQEHPAGPLETPRPFKTLKAHLAAGDQQPAGRLVHRGPQQQVRRHGQRRKHQQRPPGAHQGRHGRQQAGTHRERTAL
jgi:hypothetical protein